MVGEWRTVPLRDLSLRITKGTTPTRGDGFVPSGVNYIKSEAITPNGTIDTAKFAYIDEATHRSLARSQLRVGNVLFSMAGVYLGKSAVVRPEHVPANTNQAVGIITLDESKADSRFIHYSIQSPSCRSWVMNSAAPSAQPNFNLKEIGDLPIPEFPLEEQHAIARILGALDDKIELSHRTNETLEAMARALFKSWFVDFDGVAAEDMQESELGLIPKGWRVGALADFAELNPEVWSKHTRPDEIHYVDLSNTKWGRIEAVANYTADEAPSRAQRVLRIGDTIVGTVRPGNGSFALVSEDGLTGSTGFAALRPRKAEYTEITYIAATSRENIEALAHLADGGAYPAVRPEVVAATQIVIATDDVLAKFSSITKPIFARIAATERESRTLAALRDALLPKLLSGELMVKDAEKLAI